MMLNFNEAWDGASFTSNAMRKFGVSVGSADADLEANRDILEYRSRQLYNNAPFAGAAVETKVLNVVGTGLKCRPALPYRLLGISRDEAKAFENDMRELFEAWAVDKDCDAERENNFFQLQALALRTQLISSDAFGLRCWREVPSSPFGLCIKLLEGNRCQNPFNSQQTRKLCMGVEVGGYGEVVAYHFTKYPNFDVETHSRCTETVRVPAYDQFGYKNVIHVFQQDRPNQRRGVPWLAPVVLLLRKQGQYVDSELVGALVRSMFTVFISHKNSAVPAQPFMGNVAPSQRATPLPVTKVDAETGVAVKDSSKSAVELKAGNVIELGEGEEIQTAERHSSNDTYSAFVDSVLTEVSARLGISMEMVLKKFSTNYNAVRAAILESWKSFNAARMNLAVDFCQPVYDMFIDECVALGILDLPGYEDPMKRKLWHRCRWVGDAPVMLDPSKETDAFIKQLDHQLTCRRDVVTQINGGVWDDVAENLAEEKAVREDRGLPEPGTVSKTESTSIQKIDDSGDEGKGNDEN